MDRFNAMMESLPKKYASSSWLLHGLLCEAVGREKEADKSLRKAVSVDSAAKNFVKGGKEVPLEMFPNMNRLCVSFPFVQVNFKNHPPLVLLS